MAFPPVGTEWLLFDPVERRKDNSPCKWFFFPLCHIAMVLVHDRRANHGRRPRNAIVSAFPPNPFFYFSSDRGHPDLIIDLTLCASLRRGPRFSFPSCYEVFHHVGPLPRSTTPSVFGSAEAPLRLYLKNPPPFFSGKVTSFFSSLKSRSNLRLVPPFFLRTLSPFPSTDNFFAFCCGPCFTLPDAEKFSGVDPPIFSLSLFQ